jgi:hypothetical protein
LKILFMAGGPQYYLRQYASLVSEFAERGHEVHLAFRGSKGDLPEPAKQVLSAKGVTFGAAPERGALDGWRSVAWLVRGLADLARYTHPRYERAPVLRGRMTEKVISRLKKSSEFEPAGRRRALRLARRLASTTDAELSDRVIRLAARLESAIPTSATIDRYIRAAAPDVVLITPLVNRASEQVEFVKSAHRLGIPAGVCVASWDNLTNKGLLRVVPERVFVWNELQRMEAVELHGIPAERVVATGAQLFDEWFERRPSGSREEFVRRIGLDPAEQYVLYVCSNPAMTDVPESEFVLRWIEALRATGDERLRRLGVVVRPHPNDAGQWRDLDLGVFGNAAAWPHEGELPVTREARSDFFDSLAYSAAVVGLNTTAMIEGAIVGKSVLTVLAAELAQEGTLHFAYLLVENGGFLHVASSLEEHAAQLGNVLDEDALGADRRRRFVESFVRPHGLERPVTPILADAVEHLAELPVDAPARAGLPMRTILTLEAGLTSATILIARLLGPLQGLPATRGLRRLRRRFGAKARRLALLRPRSEA